MLAPQERPLRGHGSVLAADPLAVPRGEEPGGVVDLAAAWDPILEVSAPLEAVAIPIGKRSALLG